MKTHLYRSTRSTWCGRNVSDNSFTSGIMPRYLTHDKRNATCLVCLKADAAEQRKEDAAEQRKEDAVIL